MIHSWKKQLAERAPKLFSSGCSKPDKGHEALVAKFYRQIGQLTVERVFCRTGPFYESHAEASDD